MRSDSPLSRFPNDLHIAVPIFVGLVMTTLPASTLAQRPPSSRALDMKAEELQKGFIEDLDNLAADYEKAGLYDRAEEILRRRQRIEQSDEVAAKLEEFDERDFETNQKELTVAPSRGWTDTGLEVREGEEIRIEAQGQIRVIMNVEVGPDGLDLADNMEDVPLGSLVAVVFPPPEGRKKPAPSEPVVVGAKSQFEPAKSGRLFLRIVSPESAKISGDYDVRVSGKIRAAGARRGSR